VVAQHVQQRHIARHRDADRLSVDRQFDAHSFSESQGRSHKSPSHSLSASTVEMASNNRSPFSRVAASGLPITPLADRLPIERQRYTPAEMSPAVLFFAKGMRSSATSSGRTAIIMDVSASQACDS